jgi:hypothetical protein
MRPHDWSCDRRLGILEVPTSVRVQRVAFGLE